VATDDDITATRANDNDNTATSANDDDGNDTTDSEEATASDQLSMAMLLTAIQPLMAIQPPTVIKLMMMMMPRHHPGSANANLLTPVTTTWPPTMTYTIRPPPMMTTTIPWCQLHPAPMTDKAIASDEGDDNKDGIANVTANCQHARTSASLHCYTCRFTLLQLVEGADNCPDSNVKATPHHRSSSLFDC